MLNNITIIIPIFNEEKNIVLLIKSILNIYKGVQIKVIDDFSDDKSVSSVEKLLKSGENNTKIVIKNKKIDNKGLTYSIIKGINLVETKYFIVMDGDFQHPVKNIQNFINLFKGGKNIVIGEREKIIFKEKKYRILVSKLGNFFINMRLYKQGFRLSDPLSGFFGGETIFFQKIIKDNKRNFLGGGYKFLFEFLKKTNKNICNLGTFNFNFGKRKFGNSKITVIVYLNFIKGLFR